MIENSQFLEDAEREVARLAKQAEQEKAMAAVLPVQFEKNIAVFEKLIPGIAKKFKNYKPTREFRFFCNENGIPNLLWVEENKALYGDDPFSDCLLQIDSVLQSSNVMRLNFGTERNTFNQIHVEYMNDLTSLYLSAKKENKVLDKIVDSFPFCIMFGVGLGYQLGYLYERCSLKTLFVFEPDSDLFYASLYAFDWASLLQHVSDNKFGLHLFIGQDENNLMEDMLVALNKRGAFLSATLFAFWHYPSPAIFQLMERVAKEFYILSIGWGFFDDNLFAIAHSAENISKKIPFLLKNKKVPKEWNQTPVFVIGNGPSLDAAIPYIYKNKDKALLVSCGSSISALHKSGIKPDIYVSIERTKGVADFLSLLNDDEYLKDILFFSTDVVHPENHKYFSRSILGFKLNEPMYSLAMSNFSEINGFIPLNFVNPLVGNIGLSMPISIGFKNIYMFGLDNGYKDKTHHHSKYSAYYDKNGNPINELTKLVTTQGGYRLPGNFGGEITASRLFSASAKVMENMLSFFGDVHCFNCSDGVLIKGASPLLLDELQVPDLTTDKSFMLDKIYSDLFSPLSVSKEQLQTKLSVDIFSEVVDEIIQHWYKPLESREDAIERMMQEYEYLSAVSRSGYPHIYRTLVGTLNYVFSILSTIAYAFEDDEVTLKLLNKSISIMLLYFNDTKLLYERAFESKDLTDSETLKLYRKN